MSQFGYLANESQARGQASILQLPLSSDCMRSRATELSLDYYRKVMALG